MIEPAVLDVRAYVEYQNATSAPRTRLRTHAQEDAARPGRQNHQLREINAALRRLHERMIAMAQT